VPVVVDWQPAKRAGLVARLDICRRWAPDSGRGSLRVGLQEASELALELALELASELALPVVHPKENLLPEEFDRLPAKWCLTARRCPGLGWGVVPVTASHQNQPQRLLEREDLLPAWVVLEELVLAPRSVRSRPDFERACPSLYHLS
jgi:hypothetical protein